MLFYELSSWKSSVTLVVNGMMLSICYGIAFLKVPTIEKVTSIKNISLWRTD
ncbi:hypothetical protein BM1374165_01335 [Bartonella henselae]|uniref:Uncharacterized protein n=1 Tax=Bartonella henselae TaxID=38323 RepID=X5M8I8_BARHN|nr:hypothetical protein [Bartonella henselae]MDM9997160.1 hypothetical protein [Bartonella henselae]UJM43728.1 hypothetical protein KAE73_03015 [Bartonella henselae]CDO47318.1 hypothetical protein BM1374165_01335 [Bartonella henselae]